MTDQRARFALEGMYCPQFESGACGVGLVAATVGLDVAGPGDMPPRTEATSERNAA